MKRFDVTIKLTHKFLAIAIGIVFLMGMTMIAIAKTTLTQKLIIEIQEKGIFIAKHLAWMSADYVLTDKTLDLQLMVNEYGLNDNDLEYAFIQDSDGKVLAHTFKSGFPVELKGINTPAAGQEYRIQSFVTDGAAMHDIVVPIINGEAGAAHVGISETYIRKSVNDIVRLIIKIIIGVLILGGGAAFIFTRKITRPLAGLVEVANAVSRSNFDKEADVRSKDEIGQLGISFNSMIKNLKETTVSRDRLTMEVVAHKLAEEELKVNKQELEKKNRDIDENRNKLRSALKEMLNLIDLVITKQDHSVRFSNPNIAKCYEIKNCDKSDCQCYGKEAMRCWKVAGTFCGGKVQGFFAQKYKNCTYCEVYKKATKDPIYEIGENFNNMMHILELGNRELKNAHEKLKTASAQLEKSNNELEGFAYIVSHDLREPLRMVTSYLQLLERRYKGRLDPQACEFIGFAIDGAARMKTLITDLLSYSRVSTHENELRTTDSVKVIKNVLSNLQIAISESSAEVTYDPLPEVMSDETQLSQLLQNLIGNAIKFNNNGPPRIHVSAEEKGDEWVFSVKDNGIGIATEYKERIFGVFQRLHNREEYPGTGIGLSVCKKIVERHGGTIRVESSPGKGSTFYFTLPKNAGIQFPAPC